MIDILSIVQSTDRYNLHGHTQFCDGHADMEDFVCHAKKLGFYLKAKDPCEESWI